MLINTKGQIVIPKDIRHKFGIHPGQEIEFKEEHGKIFLVKKDIKEKLRVLAGKYRFQMPSGVRDTQKFLHQVRGS